MSTAEAKKLAADAGFVFSWRGHSWCLQDRLADVTGEPPLYLTAAQLRRCTADEFRRYIANMIAC